VTGVLTRGEGESGKGGGKRKVNRTEECTLRITGNQKRHQSISKKNGAGWGEGTDQRRGGLDILPVENSESVRKEAYFLHIGEDLQACTKSTRQAKKEETPGVGGGSALWPIWGGEPRGGLALSLKTYGQARGSVGIGERNNVRGGNDNEVWIKSARSPSRKLGLIMRLKGKE